MAADNSTQPPQFNSRNAAHKSFSWLTDGAETYPMADFAVLAMDLCHGIHTCLRLVHQSELDRAAAEDGEDVMLTLNTFDAERLLRLAMATSALLADEAERRIGWINEHGVKQLRSQQVAND